MKNKDTAFKIFLLAYAGLLIAHATKMDWGLLPAVALFSGLLLAVFAHARKGFLTVLLLAVHMSVEWAHHFEYGFHYSTREFFLHGIHVIFDGVFLVSEWRRHKEGAFKAFASGVVVAILALFIFGGHDHSDAHEHAHDHASFPFEALVVGGILGCVGTHLLEKRKESEIRSA